MAKQQRPTMTRLKGSILRTPRGVARYAYVNKPDDSAFGKDRYRITVVFDSADPEFKMFVTTLKSLASQHCEEIGKLVEETKIPLKFVDEKMSKGKNGRPGTGDPVGAPYMEFEANSSFERGGDVVPIVIPIFDAGGKECDAQVYGGDIVRVETRIQGWLLKGDHGLKGFLNACQQLKSNWSGSKTGSSFEAEAEYLVDETEDPIDELEDDSTGASFNDEGDGVVSPCDGDGTDLLDGLI